MFWKEVTRVLIDCYTFIVYEHLDKITSLKFTNVKIARGDHVYKTDHDEAPMMAVASLVNRYAQAIERIKKLEEEVEKLKLSNKDYHKVMF